MGEAKYGTPFQESEIVLAVGSEDGEHARVVMAGMSDDELRELNRTARDVANLTRVVLLEREDERARR